MRRVATVWLTFLGITLAGLTMTQAQADEQAGFHAVLAAPGRSPALPESMDVYVWLIGSWELGVLRYWGIDVSARGLKGEVHFGWVLEGRAIQDVWIMPRRSDRTGNEELTRNMYGTTFRMWDPIIQAWRITWKNPAGGHYPAGTTRSRSAAGLATTSPSSALARTVRRLGGPSRRSPRIRSGGSAKRWSQMAGPGRLKGSSEPDGCVEPRSHSIRWVRNGGRRSGVPRILRRP